jgi:hypothetical protein
VQACIAEWPCIPSRQPLHVLIPMHCLTIHEAMLSAGLVHLLGDQGFIPFQADDGYSLQQARPHHDPLPACCVAKLCWLVPGMLLPAWVLLVGLGLPPYSCW